MTGRPVEKVEAHIADALKNGAKIVTGGKRATQGGSFFEQTVLTDVTIDIVIAKEETFGPAAPLYRFKTDAEAIKMACFANPLQIRSAPRETRGTEGSNAAPSSRESVANSGRGRRSAS